MNSAILESKNITLVETLDRVLNKGVILSGDITISVANVDLIFVGLKVLLTSVETAENMRWGYKRCEYDRGDGRKDEAENENNPSCHPEPRPEFDPELVSGQGSGSTISGSQEMLNQVQHDSKDIFSEQIANELEMKNAVLPRIDAHPDRIENGLGRLILTIVELIRQLIERQAMRRVDRCSLAEEDIERLGETLMKLENKMEELKKVFGLKDEDLNLNLGPLGDLM